MKSYENIQDFLEDDSFKQWVLRGDAEQDKYWLEWLNLHPSKAELLGQAKTILLELDSSSKKWTEKGKKRTFSAIQSKIKSTERLQNKPDRYEYKSYNTKLESRVRGVLVVAFLIMFGAAMFYAFLPRENADQVA